MPNLITVSNIISGISNLILAIAALCGFLKFEKPWQKIASAVVCFVVLISAALNFYLIPKNDTISANLHLSIFRPLVVNQGGSNVDKYLDGSDYEVLCAAAYPLETRFTIILTDEHTFQKKEYVLSDVYDGKDLGLFDSGSYKLEIYDGTKLIQTDHINLTSKNLEDNGEWDYIAYIMDGFYSKAVKKKITLDKSSRNAVEIWKFSIHTDILRLCTLFDANAADDGTFDGWFYFLPGRYYLNNAISPTEMEEIIIDIE